MEMVRMLRVEGPEPIFQSLYEDALISVDFSSPHAGG